jgi:predicted DNA-binding transcriptional regulator YafY
VKATILDIIQRHRGQEQAITAREIGTTLGVRDSRQIRRAIRDLRLEGHPIASSPTGTPGYFIPTDPDEAIHCLSVMTNQIREIVVVQRAVGRAFNLALPAEVQQMSFVEAA